MRVGMTKWLGVLLMVVGVTLTWRGAGQLKPEMRAASYQPFALAGSPYGALVGVMLQEPVHLLLHGGTGHEHVRKDGEACAVCGVEHKEEPADAEAPTGLQKVKLDLLDYTAATRQNNLPRKRGQAVLKYEQQKVDDFVRLAYEMDPTNYSNYKMYAYFIVKVGMAKRTHTLEDLFTVSEATIAACAGKEEDPEDALTSATAAEQILIYKLSQVKRDEFWKYEDIYLRFVGEVKRFERNMDRAEKENRLRTYDEEKVAEIRATYEGFGYSLKSYGALIAKQKREKGL